MARMSGTSWDGEHGSRDMERWDIVCIHTIVGRAPAHAAHFSTFGDGRPPHQSRDTSKRSAANLDGNHRVIAIENEDHGPAFNPPNPTDTRHWPPLTDSQVDDCARILAWAHKTHGVPLQLCPDSRPGSRGLAYHRQGIDGNFGPGTDFPRAGRVAGGEVWTSSRGKVCPTEARIDQLPTILERAKALVSAQEDDDMAQHSDQLNRIEALAKATQAALDAFAEDEKRRNLNHLDREKALAAAVRELGGDVDAVLAKVASKR